MSVLNRNAFVVVATDVDVIQAVRFDGILAKIEVPRDQFDRVCLLAPMALRAAVDVKLADEVKLASVPDYYDGR